MGPDDEPHERAGGRVPALASHAEAVVERVAGRWVVDLVVVFDDGVVRRRIDSYRSERLARVAATWIERAANRDRDAGPDDVRRLP